MPHKIDFDEPPFGECVDCGEHFWLASGERAFFARNQIPLPKRCAGCREAKRAANARRGERPARVDFDDASAQSRRDGGRATNANRRL